MGDFNRGGSRGGFGGGSRGGFGGGSRGGFGGGEREMFDAVCDECGDDCKLPFRPSNDKPVYCSTCFEKNSEANGGNSRRDEGRRNSSTSSAPKENFGEKIELLSIKLDKIIDLLGGAKKEKVEKIEDMPATIKKALKVKEEKVEAKEEKKPAKKVAAKKTSKK